MPLISRQLLHVVLTFLVTVGSLLAAETTTTPAIHSPERHPKFMEDIKAMGGKIDLVFIGDSITDGWRGRGKPIWDKAFGAYNPLNLGISGDATQHVLWRVQNGELDGYKAKLFVVMIGTNNGSPADTVANGIQAIIKEIQTRQPQAKILLLGIFPREEKPGARRKKNEDTNAIIAKWDNGKTLRYLDIGEKFLDEDKSTLPKSIMPDSLHPNAKGYQIWADAISGTVKEMMESK